MGTSTISIYAYLFIIPHIHTHPPIHTHTHTTPLHIYTHVGNGDKAVYTTTNRKGGPEEKKFWKAQLDECVYVQRHIS